MLNLVCRVIAEPTPDVSVANARREATQALAGRPRRMKDG